MPEIEAVPWLIVTALSVAREREAGTFDQWPILAHGAHRRGQPDPGRLAVSPSDVLRDDS